ncbi:MAG: HGGxSTG domain-containing protein [Limimaricola soesokkakensis]|uniref:HGGxSTG domain-containing protein n=1 Tax=Limimaricola soesokkakensis TaxID=1343159 RepID=UPI00405A3D1E
MSGSHPRNTGLMQESPRCGARTRKGTPCQAPAVTGKARCRMHGGAGGSGAPVGNRNALKHGQYTAEARAFNAHVRDLLRQGRESIKES